MIIYFCSTPPMATNPQVFNELLLQTSNLPKLKLNQFIGDSSTKQELKQKSLEMNNFILIVFSSFLGFKH